jgi:uncharacterized membrane protein
MAWTEEQMDRTIGILLRAGVITAAVVVIAAVAWHGAAAAPNPDAYRVFRGEADWLRSPTGVIGAALHGDPAGWIQLGLLILIATPVARVAYSVFAFALQRDWTYVAVTLIVLAVLVYGLW